MPLGTFYTHTFIHSTKKIPISDFCLPQAIEDESVLFGNICKIVQMGMLPFEYVWWMKQEYSREQQKILDLVIDTRKENQNKLQSVSASWIIQVEGHEGRFIFAPRPRIHLYTAARITSSHKHWINLLTTYFAVHTSCAQLRCVRLRKMRFKIKDKSAEPGQQEQMTYTFEWLQKNRETREREKKRKKSNSHSFAIHIDIIVHLTP